MLMLGLQLWHTPDMHHVKGKHGLLHTNSGGDAMWFRASDTARNSDKITKVVFMLRLE